jgi:signal-transduction protein with cAMP-binding, CBS, and nucleotidyltransferase domain
MTDGRMHAETAVFWKRAGDFAKSRPVVLGPGDSCAKAVSMLTRQKATAVLVTDRNGEIEGILTEQDVARRLAYRTPQNTKLEKVMTKPVHIVRQDDYLSFAVTAMQRHKLRHIPVVDGGNQPVGILRLADALAAVSPQRVRHLDLLAQKPTPTGLAAAKAAQAEIARDLFRDNIPAPHVLEVLSHFNAGIYRAALDQHIDAMAKEGLGPPPVEFAVIVMGSGGRRESFLYPDQDNGFILADYPDRDHDRIDGWFVELADRMTKGLDEAGIPLCNGYVMAINPLWRKTISQWQAQTTGWIKKRSSMTLRFADIFFDFDWVYGDRKLVETLRRHITRSTEAAPAFLSQLWHDDASTGVPLGWFGRLQTIKDDPDHRGQINIKHSGLMPLTQAVRLMALKHGIGQVATLDRLDALYDIDWLDRDEADDLKAGFGNIARLLLRSQLEQSEAGLQVSNHISPDSWTRRERRLVVSAFKAINGLLDKVKIEMSGDVF